MASHNRIFLSCTCEIDYKANNLSTFQIKEKERKAAEERGTGTSEAKRRKEMLASLPKFFDAILLIFQSGNRSKITKQELIHKIISGCFSIADRSKS